ncbi:MAG: natural resistance-associated macrophage protein [Actinomycetia bacterium]|nr:natural resistance-associated macrophage protein [Actinomycetes bacterium]
MKKLLEVFLGVLTAIGGFVDIGELVANSEAGARYGLALLWPVLLGLVVILLYAEMAGRIATLSQRPVFDLVRERMGERAALLNMLGSVAVNLLTMTAEIAGVALSIQLATDVSYLLLLPLIAFAVWLVVWRVKFSTLENVVGIAGLALFVFVVAIWKMHPDYHTLLSGATHPTVPHGEGHPTYFYWAIAVFGGTIMPYELFFFSSGAVEERWTRRDLSLNRVNVFFGFPVGAVVSIAIMTAAALVLRPAGISVGHLDQAALPVALQLGKVGFAFVLVGFFAALFGASLETVLSNGYVVSQYFGWSWGKLVSPRRAPRFHVVLLISVVAATALALTGIDPVKITEYSIVFSAVVLPLTYFPVLLVANDPTYVGDKTNSRLANALAVAMLIVVTVAGLAAIPLMIATKGGA